MLIVIREILDFISKDNPGDFVFNKAIEEATEFTDALVKLQTKHPDNPKKPTREDVLKEYGDFMYRGMAVLLRLFPELDVEDIMEKVEEHIDFKLTKLEQYKAEGKYKGGL